MASSDAKFDAFAGDGTPSVFARFETSEELVSGISMSPSSSGAMRLGSSGPAVASVIDVLAGCFAGRGIWGMGSSSDRLRSVRRWLYASFHSEIDSKSESRERDAGNIRREECGRWNVHGAKAHSAEVDKYLPPRHASRTLIAFRLFHPSHQSTPVPDS